MEGKNFQQKLKCQDKEYDYFSLKEFDNKDVQRLPFTIRVLLESTLRKLDNNVVTNQHIIKVLNWGKDKTKREEVPFYPSRVLLQDYTGVPAVVDLASMRKALAENTKKDANTLNPQVPVELVIDHSIIVDKSGTQDSIQFNEAKEFQRNKERFELLKWAQQSFKNLNIVPPGSGIVHQVNLESLGRVVFNDTNVLYPDSLVGTDSHTTMINALGILGWGVGGIEAEAVMLGEYVSMLLPEVVGVKVTGTLDDKCCATDIVLKLTNILRKVGVVEKFVEFHGEGLMQLTLPDRATLSNMAPEYGATVGFFPVDENTLEYLRLTGREDSKIEMIQQYLKANLLFRNQENESLIEYTQVVELNLSEIEPSVAGPKRPQDLIPVSQLKNNFKNALTQEIGFNGFGMQQDTVDKVIDCGDFKLKNGSVLIAAITSCTNTSNPFVLIQAGLLAKKAIESGLSIPQYVKTSLSPGSKVVTKYLQNSGLEKFLNQLGFNLAGYGCMTCIGNSGDLKDNVKEIVEQNNDMVFGSVLSGNRNFEGRVHPNTKANYLCSPAFVIAYALAGRIDIDFDNEPISKNKDNKDIYFKDIMPKPQEVREVIQKYVTAELFKKNYSTILEGNKNWQNLKVDGSSSLFNFNLQSTYIKNPPYFENFTLEEQKLQKFENLHCLLLLGDSITTDHISPAGKIARKSPTAQYLRDNGVKDGDFNSYGSRRGNHEVMIRGTFGNIRIKNKLVKKSGPYTVINKDDTPEYIFNVCEKLKFKNLIVIGGKQYGTGSSRDWAGKGPALLGVKVVIAESYERIHRSNLVGMGVLPLQFKDGDTAEKLGLNGFEKYTVNSDQMTVKGEVEVLTDTGKKFMTDVRIDTQPEMNYYKSGGILVYVLQKLAQN